MISLNFPVCAARGSEHRHGVVSDTVYTPQKGSGEEPQEEEQGGWEKEPCWILWSELPSAGEEGQGKRVHSLRDSELLSAVL